MNVKRLWLTVIILTFISWACNSYAQNSSSISSSALGKQMPRYASIQNGKMEYYQFGNGSPLILIPGYVADVTSWNNAFLTELAKQHQVIVLNNRQVGGSVIHSARYETQDLANDIYQLMNALKLKKSAILGISMGGMIAQQLAVLHTDRVSQLILINTLIAGKKSVQPNAAIAEKMLNIPQNKLGRYVTAVTLFFPAAWRLKMAYVLATDRFQPRSYTEIDPHIILRAQQRLILHWLKDETAAQKMSQLTMPVLILNGEADRVVPAINSFILRRSIPHAKLVRWKEGGHAMIYQYPKEIAAIINYFLAEKN